MKASFKHLQKGGNRSQHSTTRIKVWVCAAWTTPHKDIWKPLRNVNLRQVFSNRSHKLSTNESKKVNLLPKRSMSSWGDPKSKIHRYSFLTDSFCNHLFYELHVTDTHKLINASDQTGFTPSPRDTWTCGVEEFLFTSFFYYDTITDGLKTDWMGVLKKGYIFSLWY